MDYLEFIARVTSNIPDKGQVMVRYYGPYANAHFHRPPEVEVRCREAAAVGIFFMTGDFAKDGKSRVF